MEQRIYRNTFIHFSAAEGHPLPRSQSAPNLSMPSCGEELVPLMAESHLSNFLERVAQNFRWTVRPPPPRVPGSFAHPEACSRPCVLFRFGTLRNRFLLRVLPPRAPQAQDEARQDAAAVLRQAQPAPGTVGADVAPVVELIEGRLQCDSPIQRLGWRKAELLDRSLRRMSTSRLMELLIGHPKVDTNFADQVVLLFTRARAVIQTRSAV